MERAWEDEKQMARGLRWSIAEAVVMLACARLMIAFGFRRVAPWALRTRQAGDPRPSEHLERLIRNSLRAGVALVPWESVCLPNAMAGKMMLQRRGFASTMHLGVGYREAGEMHAHAWLEAGGQIITGEGGMADVTVIPR